MGRFEKCKYASLYCVPDHYLNKYDGSDWDSILAGLYSLKKWEELGWEERNAVFEGVENGSIKIKIRSSSPKLKINSKSILRAFSLFIPKEYREIIVGDLIESRLIMKRKAYGKFKIVLITGIKVLIIYFALLKMRLSDFLVKGKNTEGRK